MPIIHEGNGDDGDAIITILNILLTMAEEAENWIFVCAWKSVLKFSIQT